VSSFPLVNYLPVTPVHEPQYQLVNHVALVQLDSVDTEPMDACDSLTAPSEGVRREHVIILVSQRWLSAAQPRWVITYNLLACNGRRRGFSQALRVVYVGG
jgi:hypothetical protein